MAIIELLRHIELFQGLTDEELSEVSSICEQEVLSEGDYFAREGEPGGQLGIVEEGQMEITVSPGRDLPPKTIVHLGQGQIIGEMSLVDKGPRSANVRAMRTPTTIIALEHHAFHNLCEANPNIGYHVMKNIAADLSFKLRHRSLEFRGG